MESPRNCVANAKSQQAVLRKLKMDLVLINWLSSTELIKTVKYVLLISIIPRFPELRNLT